MLVKRRHGLTVLLLTVCLILTGCGMASPVEEALPETAAFEAQQNELAPVDEIKAAKGLMQQQDQGGEMVSLASTKPVAKLTGNLTGVTSPQIPIRKEDLTGRSKPVPGVAQNAVKSGVKPGAFQNVTVKLKPNVVAMDAKTYGKLASSLTDNRLDKTKFGLDTSKIYISAENNIAVKFQEDKAKSATYSMKPGFSEVIDTFSIPEQTVDLNLANLSDLAEGITASAKKVPKNYAMQMPQTGKAPPPPSASNANGEDALVFTFSERLYKGFSDSGTSMDFKISGTLELIKPRIIGKYSKFSGYKLEFVAGEKFKLHSEAVLTIDETYKIPIQEFSIPAQLGKARVGVYLVIDVNGDMRLVFDVDQGMTLSTGVKGGTFFYIPTSVNPYFNLDRWCSLTSKFNGHLNAFVGPSAEVELEALGYDLLEVVARAGVETKIKVEGNDMDIKAGFRFKVYGEVVGYNFKAINEYVSFLDERRQHTGKYEMKLQKADAYTDSIEGNIVKPLDLEHNEAYQGDVVIKIINAAGSEKSRNTVQGNSRGDFAWPNANLYKGDKVYVLVPESTDNWYGPLDVTFPFDEAEILYADYFGEDIKAYVSAANKTQSSQTVDGKGEQAMQGKLTSSDKGLAYQGPAAFVLTPYQPVTYTLSGTPVTTEGFDDVWEANRGNDSVIPVTVSNGQFKGTLPGNPLKPFMQARLRIECRGFVLESKPVWTDGLILTPIKTEDFSLTVNQAAGKEEISGSNSFVVVSGKRSLKTPQGTVSLYAGMDLPHRTSQYKEKNMFDVYSQLLDKPLRQQLVNPVYYFDKSIALKSFQPPANVVKQVDGSKIKVESAGMAIAETGAWKVANPSVNPEVRSNDLKGDRHGFESISYVFEGVDLGYSNLELNCRFCLLGAGSYRWTDDTDWTAMGHRQYDITHGNMDINNLDGMGQIIHNPQNSGVVDPGRMDLQLMH